MKHLVSVLSLLFAFSSLAENPLVPFPSPLVAPSGGGSGGGVTGSGANTRVAFWTGASALSSSSTFTYDGTSLSVGSATAPTQVGIAPIIYGQSASATAARMSLTDPTAGAFEEYTLGQAADTSDSNYLSLVNFNSGFTTDGLFTAGTVALGQNSGIGGSNLLIYTESAAHSIVFATSGHNNANNERFRISTAGASMVRGEFTYIDDSRSDPANAPVFISTGSKVFTEQIANSSATGVARIDALNDGGDDAWFGTTGSTGVTLAGATRARTAAIQTNTTGGLLLNEFASASMMFATNDTVRFTISNVGLYTFAAAASSDSTSGTCTAVTVAGNAIIGSITATCTAGQTVIMNFGATYASAPICTSSGGTVSSTSTTQATFTALTAFTSKTFQYGPCGIKG